MPQGSVSVPLLFVTITHSEGEVEGGGEGGETWTIQNTNHKTRYHNQLQNLLIWRGEGGGLGDWGGGGQQRTGGEIGNSNASLPCLEMNELASEPRSLYPAFERQKEKGERNKGTKEKKEKEAG